MNSKLILMAIFALIMVGGCGDKYHAYPPETETVCNDGIDNDGDGFIDCMDHGDCGESPVCQPNDCGNGTLDATEVCDADFEGCQDDCTACNGGLTPNGVGGCYDPANCGDGVLDLGEDCDDEGETEDCNLNCTFSACGDGVLNESADEICDTGGDTAECDSDCSLPACGDGHHNTEADEACDDGGESSSCNDDCTVPICGDGNVNQAAGEQCDDQGQSAACDDDCTVPICGDGNLNQAAGEICDDNNTDSGDGCSANCLSDETCGNGIIDSSEGEVCDDSNTVNGDGCSADCLSNETCGNGTFDILAGEVCDGGTDCLQSCLCPEGKAPDGTGGCIVDPSTCGDGIDNDMDGDTDCDDTDCGVIQIICSGGCNLFVITDATSVSQMVAPNVPVTIDIDGTDQWARIYTYGRYVETQNDEGFLYWEPGVGQPALFTTSGTFAYYHAHDYGDSEWTNYSLTCMSPPPPPPPPPLPSQPQRVIPRKHPLITVHPQSSRAILPN